MLEGLSLAGYRSFGEEEQFLGPLSQINVLVGQNNSGKSNILRFLADHLVDTLNGGLREMRGVNLPISSVEIPLTAAVGFQREPMLEDHGLPGLPADLRAFLAEMLALDVICRDTELSWLDITPSQPLSSDRIAQIRTCGQHNQWQGIWSRLTKKSAGSIDGWIADTFQYLLSILIRRIRSVSFVPAIREVTASSDRDSDLSGRGIIQTLARLQNPGHQERHHRQRFDRINDFLQTVLGTQNAKLEIPHNRAEILTHVDGKTLPLSSLGTGVHEVIILAAAATSVEKQLLCIEEPELHLHPILQRKLLGYLASSTDNQYFISTHSAHLLDAPDTSVWHVRLVDGWTKVSRARSPAEKSTVAVDLGYRPSDLLQANAVVWVEGPSDRLYIRYWLSLVAPEFLEGVHYSLMFYGGRLLSHLSADDPEISDFVSLRRINRWMVVVMDSDRRKKRQRLSKTKLRVRKEYENGAHPGHVWVTAGREIENYLPFQQLEEAVQCVHPSTTLTEAKSSYSPALAVKRNGKKQTPDKVKIARKVVEGQADLDRLGLRKEVERLAEFIRRANETAG